jgi:hypothetical protein
MVEISQPPPGKIISFCPEGELGQMRLYLLPRPTYFHCSNCGLTKSADRLAIAIKNKNKANRSRQTLCSACYYKLAKSIERAPKKGPEVSRQKKGGQKSGGQPSQPKLPRIKPRAQQAVPTKQDGLGRRERLLDRFPDNFPQEIANACLQASRRIRLDRQVAYENPLVLECATGKLTLHPITGAPPQLRIPFNLRTMTTSVFGDLLLRNHDPLPMLVRHRVDREDAITAWVHALLGFADATCIEIQPTAPHGKTGPSHPRLAATVPRPRNSTRSMPRRHPWPGQLEPIGSWIRHGASFVAGHRRHLGEDQAASDQAIERAHQVGIILNPHETWVRPHTRGIPNHTEMRFRWHVQVELKQLARRERQG